MVQEIYMQYTYLNSVATDLTVPRMRPTIRPGWADVSATFHVKINTVED